MSQPTPDVAPDPGPDGDPDRPRVDPAPRAPGPPVLELRIHGVNNTTPADMLELTEAAIEQVDGDDLGSFWGVRAEAADGLRRSDPARVPDGVHREAYSWGGLARTSVRFGGGVVGTAVAGLGRLGWGLLLPFGLVNIAYWSRRLDSGNPDRPGAGSAGRGASFTRIFGLLLTLLMVTTACQITLDLLAVQCFTSDTVPDAERMNLCPQLPSLVDQLARWSLGQRVAVLGLVPVALLVFLRVLGQVSSTRYEEVTVVERDPGPATGRRGVLLSRPDFWRGGPATDRAANLHQAAGLCGVALAVAWISLQGNVSGWPVVVLVAGSVVLAVTMLVHAGHSPDAPDITDRPRAFAWVRPWMPLAVFVSGAVLAGLSLALSASSTVRLPSGPRVPAGGKVGLLTVPGSQVAPMALLGAMLLIALAATRWRGDGGPDGRRHASWWGLAPAVLMLLAVATSIMLSAIAVVTFANWLNGGRNAVDLGGASPAGSGQASGVREPCSAVCSYIDPPLVVPQGYLWFAAGALATLGVLLVVLLVLLGAWLLRGFGLRTPPGPRSAMAWLVGHLLGRPRTANDSDQVVDLALAALPERRAASRLGLLHLEDAAVAQAGSGTAPAPDTPGASLVTSAVGTRRRAAVAQHAEVLVGALALSALVGVGLATVEGLLMQWHPHDLFSPERWLLETGSTVVALIGLLVVTAVAGGGTVSGTRPLGIVWDLICVLPRAAHPLGPPCYAERAVPEIIRRIQWWLDGESVEPAAGPDPRFPPRLGPRLGDGRAVVLSAHSLGCVLAVAAICALPDPPPSPAADAEAKSEAATGDGPQRPLDPGGYPGPGQACSPTAAS